METPTLMDPLEIANLNHWTIHIKSQSQSYVMTDGQSAACPGVRHPSGAHEQILNTVRQLWVCWCRAPSLTRGWVCSLQLLQVLASAVILRSESHRTHHIFLSQIQDIPYFKGQIPIFISSRNRIAQLYN
jgi:hypothetical protein